MPEHFHLLISEPKSGAVALIMQVLKQRVSRKCGDRINGAELSRQAADDAPGFWQRRYYDFNVFSKRKHVEKLRYMHRNPVKRDLVKSPELWHWSSFRDYYYGEAGAVRIG